MATNQAGRLRGIPSVDSILREPPAADLIERHGRALVTEAVRRVLAGLRESGEAGPSGQALRARLLEKIEAALRQRTESSLERVLNATGVVVHTNLGRARLSPAARDRAAMAASNWTTLEYDRGGGERGSRSVHVERPLANLFPGRGGLAVNNNASALFLALGALARGREVILSRGELVEIGGSFRIPDVMAASGAILREIGTTNRTRLADYAEAIGPQTAMILRVHPSNYRIVGFTEQAAEADLAGLARDRGIPFLVDQGSGCLESMAPLGMQDEPTVAELLERGADLVTFSGDKLLGGPQAGLVVGRPDLIERLRRDPLYRVLRLDKMTLAALENTLDAWSRGTQRDEIPVQRMIHQPAAAIERRAKAFASRLAAPLAGRWAVATREGESRIGGGAAPERGIATTLVTIAAVGPVPGGEDLLEAALRSGAPPVISRIHGGELVLDLRTVEPGEEEELLEAVVRAARRAGSGGSET